MSPFRPIIVTGGCIALLMSAACSDPPTAGHRPGDPERVTVTPSTVSLTVGEWTLLRASASRYACDLDFCAWTGVPAEFTWRTRNRDVATVDAGGSLVRAVGPGETWVLAETHGLSDSARIVVTPRAEPQVVVQDR